LWMQNLGSKLLKPPVTWKNLRWTIRNSESFS
jgi:hypothetical protein